MNKNIYCDESCHLLNDHNSIMTLGAINVQQDITRNVSLKITEIKKKYNCLGELKWTKVSKKNIDYYTSLVDLFITETDLKFRALIVHNKESLDHQTYNEGDHNLFYYKMYYELLRNIIGNNQEDCFNIYIDIKDTRGFLKIHKLHEVLSNKFYDFNYTKVKKIQQIRSHESNILQLCDFLLGAVTYKNRGLNENPAKVYIAQYLSDKSGYDLNHTTPPWEVKFNLFHFSPRTRF